MNTEKIFSNNVLEKPETKRAARSNAMLDISKLIRMGWNENPYGMSPKTLEANLEAAQKGNFYQDFWCRDMKNKIAEVQNVSVKNLVVGAGSSPLIEIVGQAFLNPEDEVLMCPTFAAFIDMAEINLGNVVVVPLCEDMSYNLDGLAEAVTPKTKMIVVCNPNNPTGGYLSYNKIVEFINKVPKDVVLLFDEAYIEFATAPDCKSTIPLVFEMTDRPIIVMRTFSKYYGMAGVRAGYIVANEELVAGITKVPGSWIPAAAQASVVAALSEPEYYLECKRKIVEGREYLTTEMAQLGCKVYPSQSNFIMFDPHCDCAMVREKLIEKGILISAPLFCRVSVSTRENNELFIKYLKEILDEAKAAA
ncbi:MAG: histidinol-phosphate aminotransferase family protein [Butyrivibrio sp.]|nr:histidinol-phosphate aminotransferase family protein [Muribaculum sp.]MCM1551245.1 histidinol-phosphate aminotransferase family protein [Butyrivibrio sp.]